MTPAAELRRAEHAVTLGPGFHELWPTPIGLHRYPDAATLNPLLVEVFAQGRAAQERKRGVAARARSSRATTTCCTA